MLAPSKITEIELYRKAMICYVPIGYALLQVIHRNVLHGSACGIAAESFHGASM